MEIDYKTIEQFQKDYFIEFGEKISKEEACERFIRFINLMKVVYKQDLLEFYEEETL